MAIHEKSNRLQKLFFEMVFDELESQTIFLKKGTYQKLAIYLLYGKDAAEQGMEKLAESKRTDAEKLERKLALVFSGIKSIDDEFPGDEAIKLKKNLEKPLRHFLEKHQGMPRQGNFGFVNQVMAEYRRIVGLELNPSFTNAQLPLVPKVVFANSLPLGKNETTLITTAPAETRAAIFPPSKQADNFLNVVHCSLIKDHYPELANNKIFKSSWALAEMVVDILKVNLAGDKRAQAVKTMSSLMSRFWNGKCGEKSSKNLLNLIMQATEIRLQDKPELLQTIKAEIEAAKRFGISPPKGRAVSLAGAHKSAAASHHAAQSEKTQSGHARTSVEILLLDRTFPELGYTPLFSTKQELARTIHTLGRGKSPSVRSLATVLPTAMCYPHTLTPKNVTYSRIDAAIRERLKNFPHLAEKTSFEFKHLVALAVAAFQPSPRLKQAATALLTPPARSETDMAALPAAAPPHTGNGAVCINGAAPDIAEQLRIAKIAITDRDERIAALERQLAETHWRLAEAEKQNKMMKRSLMKAGANLLAVENDVKSIRSSVKQARTRIARILLPYGLKGDRAVGRKPRRPQAAVSGNGSVAPVISG